jgi:hypothetical protein
MAYGVWRMKYGIWHMEYGIALCRVIPSQAQPSVGGQVHEGISRTECDFHPDFIADSGARFV